MNKTKEILAIIDKVEHQRKSYIPPIERYPLMAKRINKLFEGMYEEEFVEWFTGADSPVAILYGNQTARFASKDKDYTIPELHKFWKENIKGK
jgi:hypothetical protein